MVEYIDTFAYKLRFLLVGALIVGSLLLLPFLLSAIWINPTVHAAGNGSIAKGANLNESPNVITRGMLSAADNFEQSTRSAQHVINNDFHVVSKSVAAATTTSGKFIVSSVDSGVNLLARGVGSGFTATVHATGNIFGFIANAPVVRIIIKPADKLSVPVIDTNAVTAAQASALSKKSTKQTKLQSPVDSKLAWPIHGTVTLEFGVPHWPYQPTHTGIDISDGKLSGITPIHPFKAGRVVEAVHSNVGFGNHVAVDHGGGLISIYGHLASISVKAGQEVNLRTVLGREGSTGASTGTHLHFEIRLDGQPIDPRKYLSGQP